MAKIKTRASTIEDAIKAVEQDMGLPKNWINARYRTWTDIRSCMYVYLIRTRGFSQSEVARAFDKNHASVINGIKNYDQLKDTPELQELDKQVTAILKSKKTKSNYELQEEIDALKVKIDELQQALNECNGREGK